MEWIALVLDSRVSQARDKRGGNSCTQLFMTACMFFSIAQCYIRIIWPSAWFAKPLNSSFEISCFARHTLAIYSLLGASYTCLNTSLKNLRVSVLLDELQGSAHLPCREISTIISWNIAFQINRNIFNNWERKYRGLDFPRVMHSRNRYKHVLIIESSLFYFPPHSKRRTWQFSFCWLYTSTYQFVICLLFPHIRAAKCSKYQIIIWLTWTLVAIFSISGIQGAFAVTGRYLSVLSHERRSKSFSYFFVRDEYVQGRWSTVAKFHLDLNGD